MPVATQIAADDVGSLIRMAKCAERTGQFKDMLDCMHKVRPLPIPLAVPTARLYGDRVGLRVPVPCVRISGRSSKRVAAPR